MIKTSLQTRFTQFLVTITLLAVLATAFAAALSVNWNVRHDQLRALSDYMSERGQREDSFFNSVSLSQRSAMRTFEEYRSGLSDEDVQNGINTYFPLQDDGSRRGTDEIYEGHFIPGYGRVYGIAGLMSSAHDWTPDRERIFYAAFLTIARHGTALSEMHESLWFFTPTDDFIIFAPDRADRLAFYRHSAPGDYRVTQLGVGDVSEPDVNPEGVTRCTPLMSAAYDPTGETLVTGCQTPVRTSVGSRVGIFGTTMFVNDMFASAFSSLPDIESDIYFVSAQGQLIAHRNLMGAGDINPVVMNGLEQQIRPAELAETFQSAQTDSGVFFRNPNSFASEAIAYHHLPMPDWYLVVSVPRQTLLQASLDQIVPIFLMCIIVGASMLAGMTLFVRQLAFAPLRSLSRAFSHKAPERRDADVIVDRLIGRDDEIGQLATTLANYRNRTEAHMSELEEAVNQRTEKLRRLSDAKSNFLATMSHELRTPMNGILGVSGALRRTELNEEQLEMIDLVQQSTQMLERQLSDVLDVSKVEAGKLELIKGPSNIASFVADLCDFHRHSAKDKGLELQLDLDASAHGFFLADEVRIKQVLNNIITNAIKFTDEGSIHVGVSAETLDETRQTLQFTVTDTGKGMDKAALSQVFEPYAQPTRPTADANRGTGLGLTISKSLVHLMEGEIHASSELGKGSTFFFRIPLVRCQTRNPSLTPVTEEVEALSDHLANKRILLAEDHAVNQRVVHLILTPLGLQIDTVENGEDAVKAFAENPYDLVLMDMRMPVMDGLEATEKIRELEQHADMPPTPIVVLSANAMPQHCDQSLAAGADMHIGKPLTPEKLITAVRDALNLQPGTNTVKNAADKARRA